MTAWNYSDNLRPSRRRYICGYCGSTVGTNDGWKPTKEASGTQYRVYICSYCQKATFFNYEEQTPAPVYGDEVEHVPESVNSLYNEARRCMSVSAYTSAVLACRKILMNLAVDQGADEGKRFVEYIEYLADNGYIPPNGRQWVDHIRSRGNEANHEIHAMSRKDAEQLITFVAGLLRFIYEFPNSIKVAEESETQYPPRSSGTA